LKRRQYVYLVRMAGTEFYKVGIASDVERRRSALTTASPVAIEIVAYALADDAAAEERKLHAILAPFRSRGEWFELSECMVGLVRSRLATLRSIRFLREELSQQLADDWRQWRGQTVTEDEEDSEGHP
jgi:hypothetical protein